MGKQKTVSWDWQTNVCTLDAHTLYNGFIRKQDITSNIFIKAYFFNWYKNTKSWSSAYKMTNKLINAKCANYTETSNIEATS